MAPLISVVIPTYNRVAFLREAVDSVLAQTLRDWELIIADDGSTDGTPEAMAKLADPRVRVLPLEHSGNPARVRNAAIAVARGRYVAFLDSDDWWEREKLSLQVEALRARPSCLWSYTGIRRVDEYGAEIPEDGSPWIPEEAFVLDRVVSGDAAVITSTVMAERGLLETLKGFDEGFVIAEDFDLWIRMAERSPVAGVDRVLVSRRRHATNFSALGEDLETMVAVYARLMARFPSGRIRRLHGRRRALWLTKVADRRRAGSRAASLDALRRALPDGLAVRAWWGVLFRTLARW